MEIPATGKQTAHVLADAISVWDESGTPDANSAAMDLALSRLVEIDGAIEINVEEGDDEVNFEVDISNVIGGSLVVSNWLIEQLAAVRGVERETIVVELREFIDAA